MKAGLLVLGVIVLVLVLGLGWAISVNNSLVVLDQAVHESWAQVQTVYQQRADLVPNLVETVKGFAAQERAVLEEVTRARASVAGIKATSEALNDPALLRRFQEAQSQLDGALSRLLVTVERYPELKSNQNFLALQSQLESIENRVASERASLQRIRPRLQHRSPERPGEPRGLLPGLPGEAILRGRTGQRSFASDQVLARRGRAPMAGASSLGTSGMMVANRCGARPGRCRCESCAGWWPRAAS